MRLSILYPIKTHSYRIKLFVALFLLIAANGVPEARASAENAGPANPLALQSDTQIPFHRELRFAHITIEDGLSHSTIRAIVKDDRGFMWFATQDGLNKYNGYEFSLFKSNPADHNSLSFNDINTLYKDHLGMLWIGTNGGGVCRLNPNNNQFTCYEHDTNNPASLSNNYVQAISEDDLGIIWIGTNGGGLIAIDPKTEEITHFSHDPENPLSLSSNVVNALHNAENGDFWVGTDNGLDLFDPITEVFIHNQHVEGNNASLSHNVVTTIAEDERDRLWIGTAGGGLNMLNTGSEVFMNYRYRPDNSASISSDYIQYIVSSQTGELWIATNGGGLNQFDVQTGTVIRHKHNINDPLSLSSDQVLTVYEDDVGIIWIGTYSGGVNKLDWQTNQFDYYPIKSNIIDNSSFPATAVASDPSGYLWIGTDGSRIFQVNIATGKIQSYSLEPDNPKIIGQNLIRSLFVDSVGTLWIGTDNGLYHEDTETGTFIHYIHEVDEPTSLSNNIITAIVEGLTGLIWVGTAGGGLNVYDPNTSQFQSYSNNPQDTTSIAANTIWALHIDTDGILWIGTVNGLDKMTDISGTFIHFQKQANDLNSLIDDRVSTLHTDRSGNLWIGTAGGLDRYNPNTNIFTHYVESQTNSQDGLHGIPDESNVIINVGLSNNYISAIQEDDEGILWISTNRGISRLDPQTDVIKKYDFLDGLQGDEFYRGSSARGLSGVLYFGGVNGLTGIRPEQVHEDTNVPSVILSSLTQGGSPLYSNVLPESIDEIRLTWPNNYFEFEFIALNYTRTDKNQYAYMLENHDNTWNYLGAHRTGKYNNLPGGNFILHIIAANHDGIWNDAGMKIPVTIIPPFWQTVWFPWSLAGLLIASLFIGYRIRVHTVVSRTQTLARQVNERTREIEQRRQVAEGLREVLVRLNSNQPLAESLNFILCQIHRLLAASQVHLFEFKENEVRFITSFQEGSECEKNVSDMSIQINTLIPWLKDLGSDGSSSLIKNGPQIYPNPTLKGTHLLGDYESVLVAPILLEGELYGGLIALFNNRAILSHEEQEMLLAFSDQAALAIGNSKLRLQAEELAALSERNRLARDLHDAVSQTLFSASLMAEALPVILKRNPKEGQNILKELGLLNRGALAEMRALLMELRPANLADARLDDLLQQLCQAASGRTGNTYNFKMEGECFVPKDIHLSLYRIAQEAITNVKKHAYATRTEVKLVCKKIINNAGDEDGVSVHLIIVDNGIGFNPETIRSDHFGLVNIRERATAIGAQLQIISEPGKGTSVLVTWKGKV